ncbi:MAG: PilN domain-containing protein [Phycisphaerae bacterium]
MHNIDFLPRGIKEHRARRRRRVRQSYIVGACVAVLVAVGYVRQGSVDTVQAELVALQSRSSRVRSQLSLREDLEKEWNELIRKQEISERFDTRLTARDVLAELGHRLPESMALTKLNIQSDNVLLDPATPAQRRTGGGRAVTAMPPTTSRQRITQIRLVITGLAPSDVEIANFVGQLASSPLFEDVHMGYTREVTYRGKKARQFQATCYTAR